MHEVDIMVDIMRVVAFASTLKSMSNVLLNGVEGMLYVLSNGVNVNVRSPFNNGMF